MAFSPTPPTGCCASTRPTGFRKTRSNYLATYYGILITNNYYYANPDGSVLANDPTGLGFTNSILGTNTIPAFGITNIPVYVNGQFVYSPAVNRLLQLAANIYDATTSRSYDSPVTANTIPLPTVFKPIFSVENGNVYITNFVEVTDTSIFSDTLLNLNFGSSS